MEDTEKKRLRDEARQAKKEKLFLEKCRKDYFEHYDKNKNGILEKEELREFVDDVCAKNGMKKFNDDFFSEIWANADDNKNSSVDFEEFMKHFGQYCPS